MYIFLGLRLEDVFVFRIDRDLRREMAIAKLCEGAARICHFPLS